MSDYNKEQRIVIQKILTEQVYPRLPEYIVYAFSRIIEETKGDITKEDALRFLNALKDSDLINCFKDDFNPSERDDIFLKLVSYIKKLLFKQLDFTTALELYKEEGHGASTNFLIRELNSIIETNFSEMSFVEDFL